MSIRAEWDRLWTESGAEYHLSFFGILHSWSEIHRPQGAALCCAVVFDGGELLGVLPMISHRHRFSKTAASCGPGSAEGNDMLLKKSGESRAIAAALLQKFLTLARPDYLRLNFVRLGSDLGIAIQSLPKRRIISSWDEIIPHADLSKETSWTAYKTCLSKNYQGNTARAARRLNELGKVTIDVVRGESDALIEWIFVHKQKWSERTNKRGDWVFSTY